MDVKEYHANAATIYCFWREVGLVHVHSLGMLANADRESALDPKAVGDHGHAFGLHQLHRDRTEPIRAKCGIDIASLPDIQDQLRGVWYELNHIETRALDKLLATTTPFDAAAAICKFYERPAAASESTMRGRMAQKWAAFFVAHPAPCGVDP